MSFPDQSSFIQSLDNLCREISSPTFEPTVIFETKLASNFQSCLIKASRSDTHECFALLIRYLRCVLALSQKDKQFLPCYFEKMDENHGASIVDILRNKPEYLGDNFHLFMTFLSDLIELPNQKTLISTLDVHHALTANIQSEPEVAAICLNIIEKYSDNSQITQELRNMKTIDWICGSVENIAINHPNHPLSWNTIVSLLGFAVNVVEGNPKSFKPHLNNLYRVFNLADQSSPPTHRKQIKELQHQLSVVFQQRTPTRTTTTIATRNSSPTKSQSNPRKFFELSIEQLKAPFPKDRNLNDKNFYPNRKLAEPIQRHSYINSLDPDLNVCIDAKSIKDISLGFLAEVICGMLNSNKGGNIHIGITSCFKVLGVHMRHNSRDEFRLTINNLFFNCLSPIISPHLISIEFIPVFQPSSETPETKFWIVMISLPAKLNTLFYLKNSEKCYMRKGSNNVLLNLREVREAAICLIEQRQIDLGAAPF